MKKFFAKLLMVAAIVAAIIAICCALGAFIAGPAGVTIFGSPVTGTLATIGKVLASTSAPLLMGGLAAVAGITAFLVDEEAASEVLSSAGKVVAGVVGIGGAALGAVTGSIGAAVGGGLSSLFSNLPSWLKIGLLGFAGYTVWKNLSADDAPSQITIAEHSSQSTSKLADEYEEDNNGR